MSCIEYKEKTYKREAFIKKVRNNPDAFFRVNNITLNDIKSHFAGEVKFSQEQYKDGAKRVIRELFDKVVNENLTNKSITIGALSGKGKEFLENLSGIKFRDRVDIKINPSELKHIFNNHFEQNEKDKGNNAPLTREDVGNIVDVIHNPNRIVFLGYDKKSQENKFAFLKKAENGVYNLVEVVNDKNGVLSFKTLYKTKKGLNQRVMDLQKPLLSTPEAYSDDNPNTNIPPLIDFSKSEDVKFQVSAWHGSPHAFDKFTTDKMGTGEGVQAFGWGLYFTDLESIARDYAEKLSKGNYFYNQKEITNKEVLYYIERASKTDGSPLLGKKTLGQALYDIKQDAEEESISKSTIDEIEKMYKGEYDLTFKKDKNLYKVTLHKGKKPSEYTWLEWDKFAGEETINKIKDQYKKQGLYKEWLNYKDEIKSSFNQININSQSNGNIVYANLKSVLGGEKQASLFLLRAGIDGIKYPANSLSGNASKDNFNYVVFDENAVTIEEQIRFQEKNDSKPFETADKTTATKQNIQEKFTDAIVVQSESDLPQAIQSEIKQQRQEGKIKGVFYNGEVYMVADNIKTLGEATGTYRHERIGHKGVIDHLGNKLNAYTNSIIDNAKDNQLRRLQALASRYGLPTDLSKLTAEQKQLLGEEYIAFVSENKAKFPNWYNDLAKVIRTALRELGINLSVNDTEIQALIGKVENNIKAKNDLSNYGNSNFQLNTQQAELENIKEKAIADGTFMKAPNGKPTNLNEKQWLQTRTKAFKEWFGDWETLANNKNGKENTLTLQKILDYAEQVRKGNAIYERLSQTEERIRNERGGINAEATMVARTSIGASSENKGDDEQRQKQENALEKWAKEKGYWVKEYETQYGKYLDEGAESKVYFDNKKLVVTKINDAQMYESPLEFLDGLTIHNTFSPETNYKLIGLTKRKDTGNLAFVVQQPYVLNSKPVSPELVKAEMLKNGFKHIGGNDYINENYIISDLHAGNVLTNASGNYFFIDPIIHLNTKEEGYDGNREIKEIPTTIDESSVSKVIDENGEPMVVYHGTKNQFSVFGREPISHSNAHRLWYFSPKKDIADVHGVKYGGETKSVFLNIKNPKLNVENEVIEDVGYWATNEQLDDFSKNGYDGLFQDDLEQIIVTENPNQIKSATDNVGSFDANNNDIRFQISEDPKREDLVINNLKEEVNSLKNDINTFRGALSNIKENVFSHQDLRDDILKFIADTLKSKYNKYIQVSELKAIIRGAYDIKDEKQILAVLDKLDKVVDNIYNRKSANEGIFNTRSIYSAINTLRTIKEDGTEYISDERINETLQEIYNISSDVATNLINNAKREDIYKKPRKAKAQIDIEDIPEEKRKEKENLAKRLNKFRRDWFSTQKGGLLTEILPLRDRVSGDVKLAMNNARILTIELKEDAKKIKFDNWKLFDEVLRGEKETSILPELMKGYAEDMRSTLDGLSRSMVLEGYVEPSMAVTMEKNYGEYIKRSYKAFEDNKYAKKILENKDPEVVAKRKLLYNKLYSEEYTSLINAGETEIRANEIANTRASHRINEIIQDLTKEYNFDKKNNVQNVFGALKQRKEIPVEYRELLGEYSDPIINFLATVDNISSMKSQREYMANLREIGLKNGLFYEKNDPNIPVDYVEAISTGETWQPLDGLYTTPEIKKYIFEEGATNLDDNKLVKTFRKSINAIKYGKTILSPQTHAVNLLSNNFIEVMNGTIIPNKGTKEAFGYFFNQSFGDKTYKGDMINLALKYNLIGQSVNLSELERNLGADTRQLGGIFKEQGRSALVNKLVNWGKKAEDLYGLEDDLFKIHALSSEINRYSNSEFKKPYEKLTKKEKDYIEKKASEIVKQTRPNYSRVWKGAKHINDKTLGVFGNFLSFQAESLRISVNALKISIEDLKSENNKRAGLKRLAGVISYMGLKTTLYSSLGVLAGGVFSGLMDDEEEENRDDINRLVQDYYKVYDKKLVYKGGGVYQVYNVNTLEPYNIFNIMNAYTNGNEYGKDGGIIAVAGQLVSPFIEFDLTTKSLLNVASNNGDYGENIYSEDGAIGDQIADTFIYLHKKLTPGFIATAMKYNEEKDEKALAMSLLGLRSYELDVNKVLSIKNLNNRKSLVEESNKLRNLNEYKKKDLSKGDYLEEKEDIDNTIKNIIENMRLDRQSAIRRGASAVGIRNADKKLKKNTFQTTGITGTVRNYIRGN